MLFCCGTLARGKPTGRMNEPNKEELRILLVADHALFRESVARVLASEPGLDVAHCGSIRDALTLLARRPFDVVLLDHDLGAERASQFLPAARQAGFEGRVLIVTAWVSDNEARRLMRQGVAGIFLKHGPLAELHESIRAIAAGATWVDHGLSIPTDEGAPGETSPPT